MEGQESSLPRDPKELRRIVLEQEKEYYLSDEGFLDFVRDSGAAPDAVYQPHGRYCQHLITPNLGEDGNPKRKLTLWPRGSYKSHVFNAGQVAWRIAKNPNIRILVCSETIRQAKAQVSLAMKIIESEWFIERFGNHVGKDWSIAKGTFTSDLREGFKREPTLTCTGMGAVQTGMHWDMVLMDDVCSQENTKTQDSIQKMRDWYGETIAQLDPGGFLFIIGTLHHHNDLYCQIMNEPDLAKRFDISRYAWCNPLVDPNSDADTELFFPSVLSRSVVAERKADLSPRLFAHFYENQPQTRESQKFLPEYFRVIPNDQVPPNIWTYILTDFAFTADERKTGVPDRTVFWVVGLDQTRVAYVLDVHVGRWKPSDSVRLLCRLWDAHRGSHVKGVSLEKVGHREAISSLLEEIRRESFTRPRLIEIEGRSQEVKDMRIEAIEPTFRNGDIFFTEHIRSKTETWREIIKEMCDWPMAAHDDIPDAISDLHKVDKEGRYYMPHPPAGWRPPVVQRYHPAVVDGRYNPHALEGFPADRVHEEREKWSMKRNDNPFRKPSKSPRKPFG